MAGRVLNSLEHLGEWAVLCLSLAIVAVLGLLDYVTGFEWSFALFYLVPVSLAAWHAGRRAGMIASVASALTWHVSNRLSGEVFSLPLIPVWNTATRLGFFVVVTLLLARLRAILDRERELSRVDPLAGVWNARVFYELAGAEVARAERYGRPLAVAYLDLDDFKAINDRFGHQVGDDVIRAAAETTQRSIRRVDTVARLGGDEFAILLPETDLATAHAILTRVQAALGRTMEERQWPVTFSIGLVACTAPGIRVDDLIRRADQLRYRAKRLGKNRLAYGDFGGDDSQGDAD
jgi:diguanylate cyclase (GGDEF)-like protein